MDASGWRERAMWWSDEPGDCGCCATEGRVLCTPEWHEAWKRGTAHVEQVRRDGIEPISIRVSVEAMFLGIEDGGEADHEPGA